MSNTQQQNWGNAHWNTARQRRPPATQPLPTTEQNQQLGQPNTDPALQQPQQSQDLTGSSNKPNEVVNTPTAQPSSQPANTNTLNDTVTSQTGVTPGPTTADVDPNPLAAPANLSASVADLQNQGGQTVDRTDMAPAGVAPGSPEARQAALDARREKYFERQEQRKQDNIAAYKARGGQSRNFFDRSSNKFGGNLNTGGGKSQGQARGQGQKHPMDQFQSRGHYLDWRRQQAQNAAAQGRFSGSVGFAATHPLSYRMNPRAKPFTGQWL